MDDQAGEEETDKDRPAQADRILVVLGGDDKRQEKQESADEEHGGMDIDHRPEQGDEMHGGDPVGNGILAVGPSGRMQNAVFRAVGGVRHAAEFLGEDEKVEQVRGDDGERGFPTEVRQHEGRGPFPGRSDHQYRRSREMGKHASDRDVDEQQADGRISENGSGFVAVELFRQQERADGDGGRLGDETAEDGRDGEDGNPPCRGRAFAEVGGDFDHTLGETQDRTARGDGHDDDHKNRLHEGAVVLHVVGEVLPTVIAHGGHGQGNHPQSEDRFDLPEEVEQRRFETHLGAGFRMALAGGQQSLAGFDLAAVFLFHMVGPPVEHSGRERVQDGANENDGGDKIERIAFDAARQCRAKAVNLFILLHRHRELGELTVFRPGFRRQSAASGTRRGGK